MYEYVYVLGLVWCSQIVPTKRSPTVHANGERRSFPSSRSMLLVTPFHSRRRSHPERCRCAQRAHNGIPSLLKFPLFAVFPGSCRSISAYMQIACVMKTFVHIAPGLQAALLCSPLVCWLNCGRKIGKIFTTPRDSHGGAILCNKYFFQTFPTMLYRLNKNSLNCFLEQRQCCFMKSQNLWKVKLSCWCIRCKVSTEAAVTRHKTQETTAGGKCKLSLSICAVVSRERIGIQCSYKSRVRSERARFPRCESRLRWRATFASLWRRSRSIISTRTRLHRRSNWAKETSMCQSASNPARGIHNNTERHTCSL